jgi:cephalosporin hydroxylase
MMTFDRAQFEADRLKNAQGAANDRDLQSVRIDLIKQSDRHNHSYQWTWLDLPIIQMTDDIVAIQEIIWTVKPDLIIETGIAWGGSIVFSASILQLLGKGRVIGIDVVLPQKNVDAIMKYPFSSRIELINGSSTDPAIVSQIRKKIRPDDKVLIMLDSNHTHDHVLEELKLYAPLATEGSYIIVSDTVVEEISPQPHRPRPWGKGNNPKTAVDAFLKTTDRFVLDPYYNAKILISSTKGGYLRCVKNAA